MSLFRYETGKVTKPEIWLRKALRKARMPFKAQEKIKCKSGREYVVDILVRKRLVIEVDGTIHDTPQQQYQDKQRDQDLIESGYTVLRIRNYEIRENLKTVIKNIKKTLKEKS